MLKDYLILSVGVSIPILLWLGVMFQRFLRRCYKLSGENKRLQKDKEASASCWWQRYDNALFRSHRKRNDYLEHQECLWEDANKQLRLELIEKTEELRLLKELNLKSQKNPDQVKKPKVTRSYGVKGRQIA